MIMSESPTCAPDHIDHEAYRLQHQSPLTHTELEFFRVVTFPSSIDSEDHEACNNEVQSGGKYGVVECLCESAPLMWNLDYMYDAYQITHEE